jgi:hypothetical protein
MDFVHFTVRAEELEKRVLKIDQLDTFIYVLHINGRYGGKERLTFDPVKLLLEWVGHLHGCTR